MVFIIDEVKRDGVFSVFGRGLLDDFVGFVSGDFFVV